MWLDVFNSLGPVSVWNNNNELLPNSIINSFRIFFNDGLPFLSLRCFSEDGHGDLQWQTEDVSTLSDNVTLNSTQSLTVIGYSHDSTLNYAEFDANKTGYYICKSYESGEEVRVFTTFGKFKAVHLSVSLFIHPTVLQTCLL